MPAYCRLCPPTNPTLCDSVEDRNEHERCIHHNYQWASNPSMFEGTHSWSYCIEPDTTACKHGTKDCEVCGTSSRRDRLHKTVGGKGLIARIK